MNKIFLILFLMFSACNNPTQSEGLELAKNWIEEKRKELHGDFLRNK